MVDAGTHSMVIQERNQAREELAQVRAGLESQVREEARAAAKAEKDRADLLAAVDRWVNLRKVDRLRGVDLCAVARRIKGERDG